MDDKELVDIWRAEFQEKCAPMFSNLHAFGENPFYFHKSGEYFFANVESAWQGFLIAKRSQPSVVLPSSKSFPSIGHPMDKLGVHGYELALSDVKSALTAAGIKYTIGE